MGIILIGGEIYVEYCNNGYGVFLTMKSKNNFSTCLQNFCPFIYYFLHEDDYCLHFLFTSKQIRALTGEIYMFH